MQWNHIWKEEELKSLRPWLRFNIDVYKVLSSVASLTIDILINLSTNFSLCFSIHVQILQLQKLG